MKSIQQMGIQQMAAVAYNPRAHYWIIGDSTTEVYSSVSNTLVPVSDPDYVAWAVLGRATPILNEAELADVLRPHQHLPAWLFNAPSFIQPAVGVYDNDQLKAYNADARWRKEQGGITATAGFPQHTDDRAQTKVAGAYSAQQEVPSVTTPWHAADGTVHVLDAAGLHQLHVDILTHINDCFLRSGDTVAQIDAGTVTTLEQIDAVYDAPIAQASKNWMKR